jgi:hypothetical protein
MAQDGSGCGSIIALGIVAIVLYQCHEGHEERKQAAFDDAVADRAAEMRAGTYEQTYGNRDCTLDCSGHEKGFEWARDNNVNSESECSSHGDTDGSFAEGCKAYVRADARAEDEVGDEKGD